MIVMISNEYMNDIIDILYINNIYVIINSTTKSKKYEISASIIIAFSLTA